MGFSLKGDGRFRDTEAWLNRLLQTDWSEILEQHGRAGTSALASNTPSDTGLAAKSWGHVVIGGQNGAMIGWYNDDVENGFAVAVAIQYGYGTGTGGYVAGRDYINPALRPVFDGIIDDLIKEVSK